MRVAILFNPVAGRGRAAVAAGRLEAALRAAGHEPAVAETEPGEVAASRLAGAAAVLVAGGDGAVRAAAPAARRSDTPVYHVPCGNENLFARQFRMSGRTAAVLAALRRYRVCRADLGEAGGHPFLVMASLGYDAEVVHDLALRRRGGVSSLSYAGPLLRQLRRWRPVPLRVTVDGRPLGAAAPGPVIVANCRRYAFGLDPARRAVPTDGRLDVLHFPARSRAQLLGWVVRCLLGTQFADRRLRFARGRSVGIGCGAPRRYQLDGDPPPGGAGTAVRALRVGVRPAALPVLLP